MLNLILVDPKAPKFMTFQLEKIINLLMKRIIKKLD
jgi:hypothetical protein